MKKLLLVAIVFSLSCKNQIKEIPAKVVDTDLLLEKSKKGLDSAIVINHKSDSATKKTITQVVREIKYLNKVVNQYKQIQANASIAPTLFEFHAPANVDVIDETRKQ